MNHSSKQTAAVLLSAVLALSSLPAVSTASAADAQSTPVYETDFEDGDITKFSKRGDTDTSVLSISTEKAHSGDNCLMITERSEGWNGPQLALADICEAGVQYQASCWVKTAWYNECMLSLQYTDSDGEPHYSNLSKGVSQGEWVQIPAVKFSFAEDVTDVFLYVETSDKVDMYVDDFSLCEPPSYSIESDIAGLKDVFADYFKVGGAVTADELAPKSTKSLVLKHYNSITLGNELKPENMLDKAATLAEYEESGDDTQIQVSLKGSARSILNFCRDNNIPVRGHVLVWHSQTPGWFFKKGYDVENDWVDKETMLKRMENYIKGVFAALEKEYSDVDFYAWDVVNEAWLEGGTPRQAGVYDTDYEKSGWVGVFGDNSFIPYAFEYARKYAPKGCKLYYNDYNEYMDGKMDAIINMAKELKEKNLIDGIGMQSHLDVRQGSDAFPSAAMYERAIGKYAELGLDIQVTELDATVEGKNFKAQAQYYSDIFDAIMKYSDKISAVVFWGTTDETSWRADRTPLIFDGQFKAKESYYSIIDGIKYTEPKETTATTTTTTTKKDPENVLLGDVNCNGKVEIADVILLSRFCANDAVDVTDEGIANSDLDKDGKCTMDDVTIILQIIARVR